MAELTRACLPLYVLKAGVPPEEELQEEERHLSRDRNKAFSSPGMPGSAGGTKAGLAPEGGL